MAWQPVVIAVLALALACDLYLRGRARLRQSGRARAGVLSWNENRRAFYELAGREFERARRYGHPFTLGYFDLDDYKEVADRFSPLTAEGMLQLVAESARRSIRASDVVARLGGDSFAVLLPEASPEAADTVIRKLQQSLRDASRETALPLCISGGAAGGEPRGGHQRCGPTPLRREGRRQRHLLVRGDRAPAARGIRAGAAAAPLPPPPRIRHAAAAAPVIIPPS